MPEIEIRPARQDDLERLIAMEHSVSSQTSLQMDLNQDANSINVNFRSIRLPRSATVAYPRNGNDLMQSWALATAIFVACIQEQVAAYLCMEEQSNSKVIYVRDLVVVPENRRKGIASGLLLACEDWGSVRKNSLVVLEMSMRNGPAILLARKLGYQFNGYQDRYFPNKDMALFFAKPIR